MSEDQTCQLLQLPFELREKIYALTFQNEEVTDWNFQKQPNAELHLRRSCRQIYRETQDWIRHATFNFQEVENIRVVHTGLSPPRFRQIKHLTLGTSLMERRDGTKSRTWSALIALNSLPGLNLDILRITPEWRLRGADDYLGIVDMIQKGCGWRKLVVTLTYWAMLVCDMETGRVTKPQDESTYDSSPIPIQLHKLLLERDGKASGSEVIVRRALDDLPTNGYDNFHKLCQAATYKKDDIGLEYHNRDLPFREEFTDVELRYEQQAPSWAAFRHLEIIVKRGRSAQVSLEDDRPGFTQFKPKWDDWVRVSPWGAGR